jgi:hypothetical protein
MASESSLDAWFAKDCVVTLERDGAGTTSEIQGRVTSYSKSGGAKSTEQIPVFGGGKVVKEMVQEPYEISFEVLLTDLVLFEPYYGASSTESSVEVIKSYEQDAIDARVTLTWAGGFDSSSPKVPNTGEALRVTYINVNTTNIEESNDADGELKGTISFSVGGQDKDGNPQVVWERTSDASTIPFGDPYGRGDARVAFGSYT